MTEEAFRAKRRQKFLTEKYFELNKSKANLLSTISLGAIARKVQEQDFDATSERSVFKDKLLLLELHFTAGEPIESLRPLYADAIHWFVKWHQAHEEYRAFISKDDAKKIRLDISPVHFEDLFHFEMALDVVSLGLLLGEGDRVREAVAWLGSERGTDMLFEAVIEKVVSDPRDVDEFFHEEPYDPLLDAIYTADTPKQASAYVKKYLDGWYKAFDGVPWHNGHLVVTDEYMAYEGYWAFEAAAVCVIHGIDDSSFRDHLVYPKDLADWARANQSLEKIKPGANARAVRLRCEGGEPCPQSGFWFTPARENSRRSFASGEEMPTVKDSPWGATIWYWDERQ